MSLALAKIGAMEAAACFQCLAKSEAQEAEEVQAETIPEILGSGCQTPETLANPGMGKTLLE